MKEEEEEGEVEVGAGAVEVEVEVAVGAAEVMALEEVVGTTIDVEVGVVEEEVLMEVEEVVVVLVEATRRGRTLAVAVKEAELCFWMHTALFLRTFNSPF